MSLLDKLWTSLGARQKDLTVRLVAITRILDECDLVEAFVRHTAQYVSAHIFIDNGSQDGTLDILEKLKAEGFNLKVYQNKSVSFNEINFNTFMFRDALSSYSADWVLCLDADEFIDDRHVEGGLIHALTQVGREQPKVMGFDVPLTEYRRSRGDDASDVLVPRRVRRRAEVTDNTKVFVSGRLTGSNVTVSGGNHFVYVGADRLAFGRMPGLVLAHYAERSPYQGAAKWAKGWAKVLAAGPQLVQEGASAHYREPFKLLRDAPQLLFRDQAGFLEARENLDLVDDPIAYRGGDLVHTPPPDEAMRAIRMMMGYLEELAARHGLLIHASPEARHIVDTWNADLKIVIGDDPR